VPKPDNNAGSWLASELLADVRQKARIPAGTVDYTDSILLEEATRAIWSFAGWAMSKSADGRLLSQLSRTSTSFLNGAYGTQREFDLPWDAVGDTFDSVVWVNGSGVETRLELITVSDQALYDAPTATADTPWGYAIVGGRLRVYPGPSVAGSVRITYQRRLPRLIAVNSAEQNITQSIPSIFSSTSQGTQFEFASLPPVVAADRVDLIESAYPYRYLAQNILVNSTQIVPSIAVATAAYVQPFGSQVSGTYIGYTFVKSGSSPYVMLPLEFKAALTYKIASSILAEIGDMDGAQSMETRAEAELGRVFDVLNPRSQSNRVKVINPYSLMRRGLRGWR
jgi:hypothetical protein